MANAFAVDTKVNDGTMTSSPGAPSTRMAQISSAAVHELVSSARRAPVSLSSADSQRWVKGPLPDSLPLLRASVTARAAAGAVVGRLKGMRNVIVFRRGTTDGTKALRRSF